MGEDPGLRPPLPLAKRLNRNALTVAAVIMGMTVLTAVVVLNPGRERELDQAAASGIGMPSQPSRPTFLDEPAGAAGGSMDSVANRLPMPDAPPAEAEIRTLPGPGLDYGTAPAAHSAREQAFEAALSSPVLAGGSNTSPAPGTRRSASTERENSSSDERLLFLGDSLARASSSPPPAMSSSARQRDFLSRAGDAGGAAVIAQVEPAGSPYTLRAGTVVPGVLLSAINSELPGEIVGQVSRNVYDSRTQRLLLLPKGSKLIGTYDNQIAASQNRLLVAWTRVIFPDGRSLKLTGLALEDNQGQTGATGRVDRHHARVFGNALLLSAIGAGAQLSQPSQGSILAAPSAGQVAAGALGQELSSVALEILRRGMDVAPTISIRQGQPFLVFLNGDLVFDGPREAERSQ